MIGLCDHYIPSYNCTISSYIKRICFFQIFLTTMCKNKKLISIRSHIYNTKGSTLKRKKGLLILFRSLKKITFN